jgi:hypothetical protein
VRNDDSSNETHDPATDALVELGHWPRLEAQVMRHRLETVDIPVMVRWSGDGSRAGGTLLVPSVQAEFARAVVTELEVDDEVPDTSPIAYIARIEEHLAAVAGLLEELRTRVDNSDEDGNMA